MTWLKIDEVSKLTGLTKRAIRYYEEIGLIDPPERTEGGTRLYTQADVDRLKRIIDAREVLGFTLQELLQFLQLGETIEQHRRDYRTAADRAERLRELRHIRDGLQEQNRLLQQKIEKIVAFQRELEELLRKVDELLNMENGGEERESETCDGSG